MNDLVWNGAHFSQQMSSVSPPESSVDSAELEHTHIKNDYSITDSFSVSLYFWALEPLWTWHQICIHQNTTSFQPWHTERSTDYWLIIDWSVHLVCSCSAPPAQTLQMNCWRMLGNEGLKVCLTFNLLNTLSVYL